MNRRNFLHAGAALAAGTFFIPAIVRAEAKKRIPISVQLYSVRTMAKADLAGTLKAIREIGYEGVELYSDRFGIDPKDVRKMMDDAGLKCSGTHTNLGDFRGDAFKRTCEIHKILGAENMIIPGGIDKQLHDVEENAKLAAEFNVIASKAEAQGLRFGYHAHGGDAKMIDGMTAWDRLYSKTNKNVVAQMDIGNYYAGGGDPYVSMEKFPGQGITIHLKPHGNNNAVIGKDEMDWKRVFDIAESTAGTLWYVVEYEVKSDNLDGIRGCFEGLREMGKTAS